MIFDFVHCSDIQYKPPLDGSRTIFVPPLRVAVRRIDCSWSLRNELAIKPHPQKANTARKIRCTENIQVQGVWRCTFWLIANADPVPHRRNDVIEHQTDFEHAFT
uniref:Uncharacterized protein n=1 Tax=Pelagomonas calceolata TaxID=35677 RepID=A0A6S8SU95_9STRA